MGQEKETVFCTNCGTENDIKAKFCIKCGQSLVKINDDGIKIEEKPRKKHQSSIMDSATSQLNSWTGGTGAVRISWKEFFSEVFKSHTEDEAEDIFIAGTKKTTPSLEEISDDKVQPWLFSRILILIILAGILLSMVTSLNQGALGDQIAMDVVLSIAVPMAALVLFFEINIYRNISFYRIGKVMLIGGVLSLVVTVILNQIITSDGTFGLLDALLIGVGEETAKLSIAAYFVQKLNIKRIFNGLLIGAAVGAGFAAFENIQYIVYGNQIVPITQALFRTTTSIGTHTEWCAIATAALVIVKGSDRLTTSSFTNIQFLRFFILAILLHMCWDWGLFESIGNIRYIVLTVIVWITLFVLIHAGLQEVKNLQAPLKNNELKNVEE